MIITRTPFRVSLFGGGTDYPTWANRHGGAVLATTINKYCYITVRYLPPFFEHRYRIVYSKSETANEPEEIRHPAVRAVLQHLGVRKGMEIHHDGDLPARSGIGSSSAFTVGLLHAVHALQGRVTSPQQLAEESIYLEQQVLRETVGSQDQVSAAFGGFNHIQFHPGGGFSVQPVPLTRARAAELDSHLMLFFTRISRTASDVAATYAPDLDRHSAQMNGTRELVSESLAILERGGDLAPLGALLHEAWQLKRSLSSAVSNPAVEEMYRDARSAGALGGKLVGAGGGGFLLLFVPPERQAAVCERLRGLLRVPIRMEGGGSRIIFFDPEEDWEASGERLSRTASCPPALIESHE